MDRFARYAPLLPWVMPAALLAVYTATVERVFDVYPFDGFYQTAAGLDRLRAGERPGVDFPVFHGTGLLLLHAAATWITGAGEAGLERARWWLNTTAWLFAGVPMLRAAGFSWRACAWSAAALAGLSAFDPWRFGVTPWASSMGLRSSLPVLTAAALAAAGGGASVTTAALAGAAGGVALFAAGDQGLFSLFAVAVAALWGGGPVRGTARALTAAGAGLAVYLLLLSIVAGGVPTDALTYAWVTIPGDQAWYFGANSDPFLSFLRRPWGEHFAPAHAALLLTAVGAWTAARAAARHANDARRAALYRFAAVYGAASWLPAVVYCGGNPWYFFTGGARMWALLAAASVLPGGDERARLLRTAVLGAGVIAMLAALLYAGRAGERARDAVVRDGVRTAADLARDAEIVRSHIDPRAAVPLWSDYRGQVERETGLRGPPVDLIIHALGPLRERYAQAFAHASPAVVTTAVRGAGFPVDWLRVSHHSFFERLYTHYTPVAETPYRTVWRKLNVPPAPTDAAFVSLTPDEGGLYRLPGGPAGEDRLWEVEVDYTAVNAWRPVPVLGAAVQYFVERQDLIHFPRAVALDPKASRRRFSAYVRAGDAGVFGTYMQPSLPGNRLELHALRARPMAAAPAVLKAIAPPPGAGP